MTVWIKRGTLGAHYVSCSNCSEAIRTLACVQPTMIQEQHNQQWNKASLGKHYTIDTRFLLHMRTIHVSLTKDTISKTH